MKVKTLKYIKSGTKDYFTEVSDRLKCNKCESKYKKSVSTKTLIKHVKDFHPEIKSKITDYYEKRDKQNKKDFRECLMRFVVMGGHAFSII